MGKIRPCGVSHDRLAWCGQCYAVARSRTMSESARHHRKTLRRKREKRSMFIQKPGDEGDGERVRECEGLCRLATERPALHEYLTL